MGIIGSSGSGKTTLLADLIPILTARGFSVSTIKHTHHGFDLDNPGKDSYRHREAGAREVLLTSSKRWALLHECGEEKEADVSELIKRMSLVDILLIEGFKKHPFPKIEVYRPGVGKPILAHNDSSILALATDEPNDHSVIELGLPVLDLEDTTNIADFIIANIIANPVFS